MRRTEVITDVLWEPATVAEILDVQPRQLAVWARQGLWFLPGTIVREGGGYRKYRADLIEAAFPAAVAAWRERSRS